MLLITAPGWAVIRGLNRQTASQSCANGDGHNCVPNKDRTDFPPVWESDHTIAVVLGALRPMLGAEAIADVYKSESPAWGKRGFLMEKRRVGTARFMSRSTAADKGSTDNGAGSGPRLNFVGIH
jgi:hypothetical protein